MPKLANVLLLAVGIMAVFVGVSMMRSDRASSFMVIGFGLAFVILGYVLDKRLSRRVDREQRASTERRIAELTKSPWSSYQSLEITIPGWGLTIVFLLIGVTSATAVYVGVSPEKANWQMVLIGLPFLAISTLGLPRSIAGLGRPACTFDRDGFTTRLHGRIAWRNVAGIHLQEYRSHGQQINILMFRIDDYLHSASNIHWTERALSFIGLGAIRRGVVALDLRHPNETPGTIEAVAKFLWKQATGHDYAWNPMLSTAYNDAARRVNDMSVRHANPDALMEYMSTHPEKALAEMEQVQRDVTTMRLERTRQASRLNWIGGIALVLLFATIAWPILKRMWPH